MRELLFLFGGVIFWIIVFIVALLIFAGIITIIVFGIKTNVKKYNEVEKRMEKSAEERHREAEEKMNESAEKHAEKLESLEEEMMTEKIKCSYCGKFSIFHVGTDYICPYCGATAAERKEEGK